jgi:hypothetical protein
MYKLENHLLSISLFLFFISFLLCFGITYFQGIPAPAINDEFAYLLTGDTFAHFRLTNQSHPLKDHFETFQVFFEPTYQAKYPPGQGFFLALGQIICGYPIVGIWLSYALGTLSLFWMLLSILPASWALLGSLIYTFNPNCLEWWGQSYWGGCVAFIGGTLLFGSLFRCKSGISFKKCSLYGCGIFILANSRPVEGFLTVLVSIPLLWYRLRSQRKKKKNNGYITIKVVPLVFSLFLVFFWFLFYNYHLTGNPLKWHYLNVTYEKDIASPPISFLNKLYRFWIFFIGPFLSFSLIALLRKGINSQILYSIIACIPLICFSLFFSRAWPHYFAPISGLLFLILIYNLYQVHTWESKTKFNGRKISWLILILYFGSSFLWYANTLLKKPMPQWNEYRAKIIEICNKKEKKDLILVHYNKNHVKHFEWVYNEADIDNADVIWARDLGIAKNKKLFSYYKNRQKWVLYADSLPPKLIPIGSLK